MNYKAFISEAIAHRTSRIAQFSEKLDKCKDKDIKSIQGSLYREQMLLKSAQAAEKMTISIEFESAFQILIGKDYIFTGDSYEHPAFRKQFDYRVFAWYLNLMQCTFI